MKSERERVQNLLVKPTYNKLNMRMKSKQNWNTIQLSSYACTTCMYNHTHRHTKHYINITMCYKI